jgi:hypothetical protein
MLPLWSVNSCNSVGLEVLAPAMLDLLSVEGYYFDFPDKAYLLKTRAARLSRMPLERIYLKAPSSLLHSLEVTKARHSRGFTPYFFNVVSFPSFATGRLQTPMESFSAHRAYCGLSSYIATIWVLAMVCRRECDRSAAISKRSNCYLGVLLPFLGQYGILSGL